MRLQTMARSGPQGRWQHSSWLPTASASLSAHSRVTESLRNWCCCCYWRPWFGLVCLGYSTGWDAVGVRLVAIGDCCRFRGNISLAVCIAYCLLVAAITPGHPADRAVLMTTILSRLTRPRVMLRSTRSPISVLPTNRIAAILSVKSCETDLRDSGCGCRGERTNRRRNARMVKGI